MADWLVYNQRVEAYGWSVSFWIFMELPLVGKIRRPMVWLAGGFGNGDCGIERSGRGDLAQPPEHL